MSLSALRLNTTLHAVLAAAQGAHRHLLEHLSLFLKKFPVTESRYRYALWGFAE